MERHVFKFGETSLAMVIPKPWADKNGLKPSASVHISETDDGGLLVSSKGKVSKSTDMVIDREMKPLLVSRWVGMHYMYGVGKLLIHCKDGISASQLDAIEKKINSDCPGFEITGQSNNDINIEDFMDMKEVTLEKLLNRLRSLVGFEFREMIEGEPSAIGKIEKLVNRFYMLGTRYTYVTQPSNELKYLKILEFMEMISDNMQMLSSTLDRKQAKLFEELRRQFEASATALEGNTGAIESVERMREEIHRRISNSRLDRMEMMHLRQISDYISSIAEFGLKV
jgi:hypothetical protein